MNIASSGHTLTALTLTLLACSTAWSNPDAADRQAAQDLREMVLVSARQSPESPLQAALKTLRIKRPATTFSNQPSEEGRVFPVERPKGVSRAEWQALQASGIHADGENGMGSYTLIDLDGDGHRDLIVDTYIGGTGLYDGFDAYRWSKGRFTNGHRPSTRPNEDPEPLYTTNMRGGNQDAVWIWLRGRAYAAYIDSHYGEDHVYLLRPFAKQRAAMRFTVRYRYRLHLAMPHQAEKQPSSERLAPLLSPAQQAAVQRSLNGLARHTGAVGPTVDGPICPPTPGAADEADTTQVFGPGHYSFEIVADVPVHMPGGCRPARLIDWFGRYQADQGLAAQLWLMASAQEQSYDSYEVSGRRTFVSVSRPRRTSRDTH